MSPDLVGRTLDGRFEIEALLGEGAAGGFVYRARDQDTGALAVVRTVAGEGFDEARFRHEASFLATVSAATADTERLLSWGITQDSVAYTVFEWLEGRSIAAILRDRVGGSSLREAMIILEHPVRALTVAHALGIAHGDVRPDNLWFGEGGGGSRIKLTQFPLASRFTPGPPAPSYGAPEHFKTSYGAIGPPTDVYGLALTLVEMVTGKAALEGEEEADFYLATSSLGRRPTPRALGAHVSDQVEATFVRALAVDPRRRYADAKSFWDALTAAMPDLTPPVEKRIPSRPPSRRRRRRLPSAVWLVLLAVITAASMVGFLRLRRARPHEVVAAARAVAPRPHEDPAVRVEPFLTDMIEVPAATFTMGTDKEGKGDGPAHAVTLTHAFYLDRTEVTAGAYGACIDAGECSPATVHGPDVQENIWGCTHAMDAPRSPANCVDQSQAAAYCAHVGKRLPTEAEWELAARGTSGREYPWGDTAPVDCTTAVVSGVAGECGERRGVFVVGSAPAGKSPYGALDMAGNVWEWVKDGYEPYPAAAVTDPFVPVNGRAVIRGGSWDYAATSAKTTYRLPFVPGGANASIGFRCARDVD